MKSRCPCTSTARENKKQIAPSLVGLWFSVSSPGVDARGGWACEKGAASCLSCGGTHIAHGPSLACSSLWEWNHLGMVSPPKGALMALRGWEVVCWCLPHTFCRGRRRVSIGWKVKMLISKYHHVFTSLELLQNVSIPGTDFSAKRFEAKKFWFHIPREKKPKSNKVVFKKTKKQTNKAAWLMP